MANVTDVLVTSVSGSDPQNLMEYITRQKIYDHRFWKEECFGLSAADVLEKAADCLKCVGGTFGGNQQPTKFLCLVQKLLQLQPDTELVFQFIDQEHFKYVRALGIFYLRLTGRPVDIYEKLEPLYQDFSKLKYRQSTEWKLTHMDELVHDLLTSTHVCGIALPRLPHRQALEVEGYLPPGGRITALQHKLAAYHHKGDLEKFLQYKATVEHDAHAIALWKLRKGGREQALTTSRDDLSGENDDGSTLENTRAKEEQPPPPKRKRKRDKGEKKKHKKTKYGSLFKKDKARQHPHERESATVDKDGAAAEGSVDFWNAERAKLGLAPLRK